MAGPPPVLVVVAGPNGSGKSTFFDQYLSDLGLPYVNADRIARVHRKADRVASVEAIDRRAFATAEGLRQALLEVGWSFCTETVFSDPAGAKLRFLATARARGFAVIVIFIGLAGPALSIARVMQRVKAGGHDIPDEKLRARFPRTLANLRAAVTMVDETFVFDNSSDEEPFRLAAVYAHGALVSRYPPRHAWLRGLPGL